MVHPLHVKMICGLAVMALATDVAPPTVDAIGRLTLDGALVIAVGVLWRALTKKDDQVVSMATKVTETMTLVNLSVAELRNTISDLRNTVTGLKVAYEDLPCAMGPAPERAPGGHGERRG